MADDIETTEVAPELENAVTEVIEAVVDESSTEEVVTEGGNQVQEQSGPVDEPREPVADVETPPEPTLPDLTGLTPTQVRDLAPELARELEYAGEQRREAQLRRESGSREATRARVEAIKAKLAELSDGDTGGLGGDP